jgi:hypothetical protein
VGGGGWIPGGVVVVAGVVPAGIVPVPVIVVVGAGGVVVVVVVVPGTVPISGGLSGVTAGAEGWFCRWTDFAVSVQKPTFSFAAG